MNDDDLFWLCAFWCLFVTTATLYLIFACCGIFWGVVSFAILVIGMVVKYYKNRSESNES